MRKRGLWALLALLIAAFALVAVGCGGDDDEGDGGAAAGDVEALPASSCRGLEYEGEGEPDLLITSDFPRQGAARAQTSQMADGIRYVLGQRDWKAGDYNIAYQDCDDATAQAGAYTPSKCSQNARAYVRNESVIGVIGTYNSGCMQVINPILNQAPGGPIAMISPANTLACLTEAFDFCPAGEPEKWYPTGKRNYVRMVAHDVFQGAAVAQFMNEQGVKNVYILNDATPYGIGVAAGLRNALGAVDIGVAGFSKWDSRQSSYEALFRRIKGTGADAVFFGGVLELNGGKLIKDKVAVLGPNDGAVKMFGPDGFYQNATFEEAGVENANGGFYSIAGIPVEQLKGRGKEFVDGFKKDVLGGKPVDPYAAYAAQAAEVLLDAIAASDGTRNAVVEEMFQVEVVNGILGSFEINANGDPETTGQAIATQNFNFAEGVNGEFKTVKTFAPSQEFVDAAAGG